MGRLAHSWAGVVEVGDDVADKGILEPIFTADEAADRLRLTRRAVVTAGKRYGLCFVHGRSVLFTESQLVELVEAMRFKPSSTLHQTYFSQRNGEKALASLRERLNEQRAEHDAKKAANALARREASLQRQRDKAEVRRAAKAEKQAVRDLAKRRRDLNDKIEPEPLDHKNRDPGYWTDERKRRLREERVARMVESKKQ